MYRVCTAVLSGAQKGKRNRQAGGRGAGRGVRGTHAAPPVRARGHMRCRAVTCCCWLLPRLKHISRVRPVRAGRPCGQPSKSACEECAVSWDTAHRRFLVPTSLGRSGSLSLSGLVDLSRELAWFLCCSLAGIQRTSPDRPSGVVCCIIVATRLSRPMWVLYGISINKRFMKGEEGLPTPPPSLETSSKGTCKLPARSPDIACLSSAERILRVAKSTTRCIKRASYA